MSKKQTSHAPVIVSIIVVAMVVAAAVTSFAFWLWFQVSGTELHGKIRVEVIKVLLHFAIVVVIGSLIALALNYVALIVQTRINAQAKAVQNRIDAEKRAAKAQVDAEDELRRKNQVHSDIRRTYLTRVGTAYRAVKSIRRSLRAGGLTRRHERPPAELSKAHLKVYRQEMERLNDSQLQLEELNIEARVFPAFRDLDKEERPDTDLKAVESYIRQILRQYEKAYPRVTSGDTISFEELDALDEFTDDRENGKPFDLFCKHYDNVVETLSRYLK